MVADKKSHFLELSVNQQIEVTKDEFQMIEHGLASAEQKDGIQKLVIQLILERECSKMTLVENFMQLSIS